jgi:SRSO17 transposase
MVKPRSSRTTVQCVDTYGELYRDLFIEVRADESFKYLQLGLISDLKSKSLPAIAKALGLENAQGLHHFISQSPWQAKDLETRRLKSTANAALNKVRDDYHPEADDLQIFSVLLNNDS